MKCNQIRAHRVISNLYHSLLLTLQTFKQYHQYFKLMKYLNKMKTSMNKYYKQYFKKIILKNDIHI